VSDGAGGAIVTWQDLRGGASFDIYAQHVLASGVADPAWPANGRALCTAANYQYYPTIVSDGAGGAIVTWQDVRGGANYDIYAQHVLASGVVDPAWPANGRALCTAASYQYYPTIVSDGAGGAIVTWYDVRGGVNFDIYAQHVFASGAVDPAWPPDGRALSTAVNNQLNPAIVSDGAGGAIVTWMDLRGGVTYDIYAQHVLASGAVDAAWPVDGRALCTAANTQSTPTIVSDGAGGAIVTWYDIRTSSNDIYAQHVLASGAVDPAWPADGRALCTATGSQFNPTIVSDGASGAIVAWYDFRSATSYDIYTQHVLPSGVADPAWPVDGRALCTAVNNQQFPTIVSDGAGGAIVTWMDLRVGASNDIYAQHVLASGVVDAAWPTDGRALCSAAFSQESPMIVSDGAGSVIVTWFDNRGGTYDIYAQRVGRHGYLGTPEAEIVQVKDVPNDQGGLVKLSWNASYLDQLSDPNLSYYDILRSVPTEVATSMKARGARVHSLVGDSFQARPGDLISQQSGVTAYYWEYLTSLSALHYLSGYSYIASTLGDSVAASNPRTAFMVVARNSNNTMYWLSNPDSGYSVDNRGPAVPAPFTGEFAAGTTYLHWNPNTEADLAGYRLYRGASLAFVPGPGNLVAALPDTGYADVAGTLYFYKLTAVDTHGNESLVATLTPTGTLAVGDSGTPREMAFAPPSPNPAGATTSLGYSLPRASVVRLAIYDPAGRLVRELVRGAQAAGEHAERWDLREANGRAANAGLYFARLECDGRTMVRRVAVTR